jgi:periodic tryptophan protein 2
MKLNETNVIKMVFFSIPIKSIELVISSIPLNFIERFISFLSKELIETTEIEFTLIWVKTILITHGEYLSNGLFLFFFFLNFFLKFFF